VSEVSTLFLHTQLFSAWILEISREARHASSLAKVDVITQQMTMLIIYMPKKNEYSSEKIGQSK
jgi:hypothetical protein